MVQGKKVDSFKDLVEIVGKRNYNKPNSYGEEGVDHINISLQSNLPIGEFLDPTYVYEFENDIGGTFRSVLNLVFWLRSNPLDDGIRKMNRTQLKMLTRSGKSKNIKNHLLVLLYYSYLKVMSNPKMVSNIRGLPNNLEVLSYTVDSKSKIRIANNNATMVVPVMKELIRAVKENRKPNYSIFINSRRVSEIFTPPAIKQILDDHFNKIK